MDKKPWYIRYLYKISKFYLILALWALVLIPPGLVLYVGASIFHDAYDVYVAQRVPKIDPSKPWEKYQSSKTPTWEDTIPLDPDRQLRERKEKCLKEHHGFNPDCFGPAPTN